ncbi:hypothetical protein AQUCO_04500125v1 [Aquilegia coerulea]|uniref:Chromo domain-containing protein n=1 Tax=Aquilegia coerulea TaxID=218851 RepID=A0A2G5CLY0_AQUCA|nr:hypothetical protein AQUCO_04500125v1 [Aquilegia coerulea]
MLRFFKKDDRKARHNQEEMQINLADFQITPGMSYVEKPVKLFKREERELRRRKIPFVQVLWTGRTEREATWERKEDVRRDYPVFFDKVRVNLEDEIPI